MVWSWLKRFVHWLAAAHLLWLSVAVVAAAALVELADQAQKLFKAVAEDVGIGALDAVWVAEDFYNQGVGFNCSFKDGDIDTEQVGRYLKAIDVLSRLNAQTALNDEIEVWASTLVIEAPQTQVLPPKYHLPLIDGPGTS